MDIHYYTPWSSNSGHASSHALITNRIREIKDAIRLQATKGNVTVTAHNSRRVFDARTRKGQLQVRFDTGKWENAERVTIAD